LLIVIKSKINQRKHKTSVSRKKNLRNRLEQVQEQLLFTGSMEKNWLSEGTKKAIPGMERPLTIACHMKIFDLGLSHYPASWDLPSSR
jgi:hypothetical protein